MNVPRLLRAAQLLEHWAERKSPRITDFNLGEWFTRETRCSSVACAVGTLGCDPWFKSEGLTLTLPSDWEDGDDDDTLVPTYQGHENWQAVTAFFDIAHEQAIHLFSSSQYEGEKDTTPAQVAERIRELIGIPRGDDEPGDLPAPDLRTKRAHQPA